MATPNDSLFASIIDSMPFVVTSVAPDGTILFVNGIAARNLSGTRETVVGKSLYDYFPDRASATRERIKQTITRRETQHFESVVRLPDGSERWFDSMYCPAFDDEGRVIAVQIIAHDVTAQRKAEAVRDRANRLWGVVSDDLSMTAERISAILASAPMFISIHDPDTTIRYINRGTETSTTDQVIGSLPALWLTESSRPAMASAFAKVRDTAQPAEFRGEGRSGKVWFGRLAPLMHDGQVVQILCCTIDITEQARLQAQLSQRQKSESLGTMARGIAHDFNNLLAVIMGDAGLMRRRLAAGRDPAPLLDAIDAAAERAADLCKQMLVYAGRDQRSAEPGHLNRVIDQMGRLTRAAVNAKIDVVYDLADELPPTTCGGAQLGQIVLNLINNAADSVGDDHGRISISTASVVLEEPAIGYLPDPPQPGRYVQLCIEDTGHGIDAAAVTSIFDPFYSTKSKGHGLGLSVVLGIVASHGAGIAVESSGGGTRMTVLFPVHEEVVSEADAVADDEPWPTGSGTVLVVDDEEAVRLMAAATLADVGYRVVQAGDGDEALAVLAANRDAIRAVVLDVTMPRRDGYSTLAELRKAHPTLPVVLSSGKPMTIDADPHLALLPKPYTPPALARAVADAVSAGAATPEAPPA